MPKATLLETNDKQRKHIRIRNLYLTWNEMVYTFDSNTIELYLKLCLWTMLHHDRGTIKIYILMDIKGSISTSTHLTERAVHDSPIMDKIPIVRVNSLCLHFHLNNVFFVTRVKREYTLRSY